MAVSQEDSSISQSNRLWSRPPRQNEQEYFDELATRTLDRFESDQQRAGQQGRAFIERLLGTSRREALRETRQLTRDIENILSGVSDVFIDIARGQEIPDAFEDLGERIGFSLLSALERELSENLADVILDQVSGAREQTSFLEGLLGQSGSTAAGGGSLLSGLGAIGSLLTNPATIAAAFLALPAYGAYRHLTDDDVAPAGRGRGIAPIGDLPSEPFNRGQRYSRDTPTFARGRGYQREIDDAIAEIDAVIEETVEQSVAAFGGFYGITLRNLQERLGSSLFQLGFRATDRARCR